MADSPPRADEELTMLDRPEIAVTLPARVLDRLRREALAGGLPLPWLVVALADAQAAPRPS